MNKTDPTWKNLQRFANEHKLILEDCSTVGFGRPCVGFCKHGNYVEYNPYYRSFLARVWPHDRRLLPPKSTPNAYYKHDCLCVLIHDGNYDAGLVELNSWVNNLESQGIVRIETYKTDADELQAIFSGLIGYAVRLSDK